MVKKGSDSVWAMGMYRKYSETTTKFVILKTASETRLLAHRTLIQRLTNYTYNYFNDL